MYGRPPTDEEKSITRKLTTAHDRRKVAFIKGIIITTNSRGTSIRRLERSCHEKVGDPDGPDKPRENVDPAHDPCHAAPT